MDLLAKAQEFEQKALDLIARANEASNERVRASKIRTARGYIHVSQCIRRSVTLIEASERISRMAKGRDVTMPHSSRSFSLWFLDRAGQPLRTTSIEAPHFDSAVRRARMFYRAIPDGAVEWWLSDEQGGRWHMERRPDQDQSAGSGRSSVTERQ